MSLLHDLANLLDLHSQPKPAAKPQPQQKADVTYNPNPATNIPNSSHDLQAVQLMPGHTGVPVGQVHLGTSDTLAPAYSPQGGNFNPGAIPLQQSNTRFGQIPQFAAYQNPPMRQYNPQAPRQLY